MSGGTVCVVGSLNIDIVTQVAAHPKPGETVRGAGLARLPGGKGANQALAAARAGAVTKLVGRIGPDGTGYRSGLAERGVDCGAVVVTSSAATGHALIAVDERGENTIIVIPGANDRMTEDVAYADSVADADVLLLQLEIPFPTVHAAARFAAGRGVRVILNPSPWAELPGDLLALADPLIVNEHEAAGLDPDLAASCCVTLGGRGARWGGIEVTAPATEVVDTTGAGDAFAGTLAATLAAGADREDALRAAVEAGAHACTWPGAQGWEL